MEPAASFGVKKSPRSSASSLILTTVIPVALLILLSSFLFSNSSHHRHSSTTPPLILQPPPPQPPHSFIRNTCTNTLYPNLCYNTLSTGNFTNVTAAIQAAPNRSARNTRSRYVIQIKTGIYNENLVIPRQKVDIMLVGEGMNSTIITSNKNFVDGYTTFTSATLTVVGNNFLARDLTIINTSGPEKHQAVALRVTSDAAFYHCQFISHQDTLYAHSLSQLYRECVIHGTVDFIFGNAAAIFERCLILVRKPILGQKNVITAQGRLDPNQNTGISLQDCTIMAAPDFKVSERANFSTFLGRPWRNYSRTVLHLLIEQFSIT